MGSIQSDIDDTESAEKKNSSKILFGRAASGEYADLLKIAEKCRLKFKLIERKGLPFFYANNKHRKGLIFGFLIFIFTIQTLSLYIWNITVIGAECLNAQTVISAAHELGIYPGSLRKRIDVKSVNQKMVSILPEIAWLSVNIDGCTANIEIKERIKTPEIISEIYSHSMKASVDGRVMRVETYKGVSLVSAGDAVTAGQILISSQTDESEPNSNLQADGRVWAQTRREFTAVKPLKEIIKEKTRIETKIFRLWLAGKEIQINFWIKPDETWEKLESVQFLKISNLELPIAFCSEQYNQTEEKEICLTPEEALSQAKICASEKLNAETNDIEVLEQTSIPSIKDDKAIFTIYAKCLENIAISS
jgi:similar to stage IV sporulation protein